jgi:hypothetical protein
MDDLFDPCEAKATMMLVGGGVLVFGGGAVLTLLGVVAWLIKRSVGA